MRCDEPIKCQNIEMNAFIIIEKHVLYHFNNVLCIVRVFDGLYFSNTNDTATENQAQSFHLLNSTCLFVGM